MVKDASQVSSTQTDYSSNKKNQSNDANKELESAKKLLNETLENGNLSSSAKANIEKAIGNIDKKMGVAETEKTSSANSAKVESAPKNNELSESKKLLTDTLENGNLSSSAKANIEKAIENIDKKIGTDAKESDPLKDQSKSVTNAFDKIKDVMESFGKDNGVSEDVKQGLDKMQKYLSSTDDSDTQKLNKMKEIMNDTFSNYSNVKNFDKFFESKKAATAEINSITDSAQKSVDTQATGVSISDKATNMANNEVTQIAKLPFEFEIPKNNQIDYELLKAMLSGKFVLDVMS